MTKCISVIKNFVKNPIFQSLVFFIIYFTFCSACSVRDDAIDSDFWSRLIMGQHVFQTGTVMKTDIVSYTPTHIWYDHEWLLSTIFYIILTYFGPFGITIFKTLLAISSLLMVNLVIEQNQSARNYKYKYVYLLALAGILFYYGIFTRLRCQHITFLLFPLFIFLLERIKNNPKSKAVWSLPFIMLFWLNCYGGAVVGLGMIFIYAFFEFTLKRPSKHLFIAFIFSCLVWIINPWGIDFIKFMFYALTLERRWIAEWQSPITFALKDFCIFISEIIFVTVVYIYSVIRRKVKLKDINYAKLLILIILTYLGMRYIKHIMMYFIGVFSYMYEDFKVVFDDIFSLIKKYLKIEFVTYPLFMFIALIYSIYVFSNFSVLNNYYGNTIKEIPIKPLQFLRDNSLKGKIFALYSLSCYIAYKEYPDLKIYIDGRQEQVWDYPIFRKQMRFLFYIYPGAESVLKEYKPDIILIDNVWKANMYLQKMQDYYKLIYDDGKYYIYIDPSLQKEKYIMPDKIRNYNKKNLFKTNLDFRKKSDKIIDNELK